MYKFQVVNKVSCFVGNPATFYRLFENVKLIIESQGMECLRSIKGNSKSFAIFKKKYFFVLPEN